jgi:hypothetical protein
VEPRRRARAAQILETRNENETTYQPESGALRHGASLNQYAAISL